MADEKKFEALVDGAAAVTQARESARVAAIRAVRELEFRVVEALAGSTIRNLPNLCPEAKDPFRGVTIRARGNRRDTLPLDGRPVLVLCADGLLRMVMRQEDDSLRPCVTVHAWPVEDAELLAEDARALATLAADVLEGHLAHVGPASKRYPELRRFAEGLTALCAA